jgi:Fe-S-cluster containining protein
VSDDHDLPAGDFSSWMVEIRAAIGEGRGSDVPCNGCTACCRSSQFVHIGPDETETLSHIPPALLFPAPGRPRGHVLLGYDEHGHCPMLVDDRCSIYAHRPNACRTYDCRIFGATGTAAGDQKVEITRRARRWQFSFSTTEARTERDAVRAAVSFLEGHPEILREAGVAADETQLAVAAVEIHELFLARDEEAGRTRVVDPEPSVVRAALASRRRLLR